ncbi:MAG: hypothetical protein MJK04_21065, partial [Psychrosphaera sp.]|nr:hypothetical protein [Psychrosphaera sp.]
SPTSAQRNKSLQKQITATLSCEAARKRISANYSLAELRSSKCLSARLRLFHHKVVCNVLLQRVAVGEDGGFFLYNGHPKFASEPWKVSQQTVQNMDVLAELYMDVLVACLMTYFQGSALNLGYPSDNPLVATATTTTPHPLRPLSNFSHKKSHQ